MSPEHAPNATEHATDLAAMVRGRDYRRFLAIQLAPPGQRDALYAITAFASELRRVPLLVNEPLAGFMRFAWWRDALHDLMAGKPAPHHPIWAALAPILAQHPPLASALEGMIAAGQHMLEDGEDATPHPAFDTALEHGWCVVLGAPESRALLVLERLPTHRVLGWRDVLRVVWFGLKP